MTNKGLGATIKGKAITCENCGKILACRESNILRIKFSSGKFKNYDYEISGIIKLRCPRCRQINIISSLDI